MATLFYDLTTTPTDIVAEKSLTAGTLYGVQYQGEYRAHIVAQESATAAPEDGNGGFILLSYQTTGITPVDGEKIYVWYPSDKGGDGGILVIEADS